MIDWLITHTLNRRALVLLFTLILSIWGIISYKNLPIDAYPDISTTQVKIIMQANGLTPQQMEAQVTTPIERQMIGIPHQTTLRSLSKYGLSDITIDFTEDTDIYWARQQVTERLNAVLKELPSHVTGGLAPISTPLSDILMFTVQSNTLTLEEKHSLLKWEIAPKIRAISGVADVNILGGKVKAYEIIPNTAAMQSLGISTDVLIDTIKQNSTDGGAGRINQGEQALIVQSHGNVEDIEDIKSLFVAHKNGTSVYIKDIATVKEGAHTRVGFVTQNGTSETVQGIVLGLRGIDTTQVLDRVKASLKEIEKSLPNDTTLSIFYDRSNLITLAVNTVNNALFQAVLLIIIVLYLFLGNVISALSVSLILPLTLLSSFIAMQALDISANLMSLGGLAIALGLLVDSAIVIVEHTAKELSQESNSHVNKKDIILRATKQMSGPIITGVFIIVTVFLPLLTLEGLEGKLFIPVALSIVLALFSSLVLALLVIPTINYYLLKQKPTAMPILVQKLQTLYIFTLKIAITHMRYVLSAVVVAFGISMYLLTQLGTTFMPTMDEGSTIIGIEMDPSISLEASRDFNLKIQQELLARVPQIKRIVARTGSDALGLDPMSLNDTDTFLVFYPQDSWDVPNKETLMSNIRTVLDDFAGISYRFTQPIDMRVSEMLTGSRADVAINIYGEDLSQLEKLALQTKEIVQNTPGAHEVYKSQNDGVNYLSISFNRDALARHHITQDSLNRHLKSLISGVKAGVVKQNMRSVDILVKAPTAFAHSVEQLKNSSFVIDDNISVPISSLVDFDYVQSSVQIKHENAYRKSVVQSNVSGTDLGSFVKDIQSRLSQNLSLPQGYFITYTGEFENQQRASSKLIIIVPLAVLVIALLLYISFGSFKQTVLVLINIPLALIGGIVGLYVSGEYLSVPASVGFIALLGIAILNGIVLVNYFNYLRTQNMPLLEAVLLGAKERLRPVLMTALTAALGLFPLLFATGVGSEIQKPLAIVVIWGLISSTLLTLIVLPILYRWIYRDR